MVCKIWNAFQACVGPLFNDEMFGLILQVSESQGWKWQIPPRVLSPPRHTTHFCHRVWGQCLYKSCVCDQVLISSWVTEVRPCSCCDLLFLFISMWSSSSAVWSTWWFLTSQRRWRWRWRGSTTWLKRRWLRTRYRKMVSVQFLSVCLRWSQLHFGLFLCWVSFFQTLGKTMIPAENEVLRQRGVKSSAPPQSDSPPPYLKKIPEEPDTPDNCWNIAQVNFCTTSTRSTSVVLHIYTSYKRVHLTYKTYKIYNTSYPQNHGLLSCPPRLLLITTRALKVNKTFEMLHKLSNNSTMSCILHILDLHMIYRRNTRTLQES